MTELTRRNYAWRPKPERDFRLRKAFDKYARPGEDWIAFEERMRKEDYIRL